MIESLLVANRGEIACRIFRTAKRLGIRTIAVFSDADALARHVREADEAIRIGPAAPRESYLNVARLLDAARATGMQTAYVPRPLEWGQDSPVEAEPGAGRFDIVADDFHDLADQLGA